MAERKEFIINFTYFAIIAGCIALFGKYVLPIITPFIIAFVISYFLKKPINRFCKKEGVNKRAVSIIVLILFYIFIASLFITMGVSGYAFVQGIVERIPSFYTSSVEPIVDDLYKYLTGLNENMNPEIKATLLEVLSMVFQELKDVLMNISNWLIKMITNLIAATPGFFVSFILTIISSFFIIADYDQITSYIVGLLGEKEQHLLDESHYFLKNKLFEVIKSYIKIMTLTFIELAIGLYILKIKNPVALALMIAIFDILPVLGTGGIIIPWGLISLCYGNYYLGFGLLILYVVITVIRNVLEPKLVGAELGLHPIATLASMLVGVNLFGVIGLFGFPILLSFILYEKEKQKECQ